MVGNGAGIAIQAFTFVQWLVLATVCARARVYRAGVSIITRVLVGQAIAIIVDAIAAFRFRGLGRAFPKSRLFA